MSRYGGFMLLLTLACGCGDDETALEHARLGIYAEDVTGREAVVACEQLPLLQGSRSYATHVIDDRLVIEVMAEPSQVALRFESVEGISLQTVNVSRVRLLDGGKPQIVQLVVEQRQYFVTLSMGCEP